MIPSNLARYGNQTSVSEFILVGFSDLPSAMLAWLSMLLLCIYLVTLIGNMTIILLVTLDPLLQTTMYLFLRNLSFLEICYTSVTLPKLLIICFTVDKRISFLGCAAQIYFFFSIAVTECFLLAFMAYDRYVAICNPLRYVVVMNRTVCAHLSVVSLVSGLAESLGQTAFIFSLPYCECNIINHFFCDIPSVLSLACADTFRNEVVFRLGAVLFGGIPFLLVLSSYIRILSSILGIRSRTGRWKAFSTCSSHLTSVILFYGMGLFAYSRPISSHSPERDKLIALLCSFIIPMVNPLIYSLRNQEVKAALRKFTSQRMFLPRV